MVNINYKSTEDMIIKLQSWKGKTKLKFFQNISNSHDEMNYRRQGGYFQFREDPFAKNSQGIGKIFDEVLSLMKFLHTKPRVKSMNINYYDLDNTVFKNSTEGGEK